MVDDTVQEAREDVKEPIVVTPTTLPEQLFALMRQLTLILGGFATLATYLEKGDTLGLVEYLRSSPFVGAVITAATLAALIYGNLKMKWRKQELIVAADSADDSVAKVVAK